MLEDDNLDAIELLNRSSVALYWTVRRDWFWLLDRGVQVTGTGNSDSHAAAIELAGFPINLVQAPRPTVDDATAFTDAIRAGAVSVTTGPIVSLTLRAPGGEAASLGEVLSGPGPLQATVRVRAAPWVPVDTVRLIVGGEVHHREDLSAVPRGPDGVLDITRELSLTVPADRWVLAEAGWPLEAPAPADRSVLGDYALITPHYVPLAFTNPIFIDGDGDGVWHNTSHRE